MQPQHQTVRWPGNATNRVDKDDSPALREGIQRQRGRCVYHFPSKRSRRPDHVLLRALRTGIAVHAVISRSSLKQRRRSVPATLLITPTSYTQYPESHQMARFPNKALERKVAGRRQCSNALSAKIQQGLFAITPVALLFSLLALACPALRCRGRLEASGHVRDAGIGPKRNDQGGRSYSKSTLLALPLSLPFRERQNCVQCVPGASWAHLDGEGEGERRKKQKGSSMRSIFWLCS